MFDIRNSRRTLLVCLGLAALTVMAFWPVTQCEFTSYDDPYYLLNNPHVRQGLTPDSVKWAFTSNYAGNWHPLTWLSHMLDVQLFGLNPAGHHLINLAFHLTNSLLLFLLLRRMTGAHWRSALAAALFALHPLRVESVAWVSERKDVLSAFFFLLTLWAYARYAQEPGARSQEPGGGSPKSDVQGSKFKAQGSTVSSIPSPILYLLSLAFFALGLISKPMLVTLPFVLLLLDFWPLGRLQFAANPGASPVLGSRFKVQGSRFPLPLLLEKLPFFALTAISCLLTVWAQQRAMLSLERWSFGLRISNAMLSYIRYLWKTIWPVNLAAHYPLPHLRSIWLGGTTAILLLGLCVLVVRLSRRRPYLIVGWLWFLGTLVPALGLVQVGSQAMADRYTYVPLIGIFIIAAWSGWELATAWRLKPGLAGAAALLVLACCVLRTHMQVQSWRNSVALFTRATQVTPGDDLAWFDLGVAFIERGDFQSASKALVRATEINPAYVEAWDNLGSIRLHQGDPEAAIRCYSEALKRKPDFALSHHNLGVALAELGRLDEAITKFQTTLKLDPALTLAQRDLGRALAQKRDFAKALPHLREYVRLQPDDAEGRLRLADALWESGDREEAQQQYAAALTLQPDWPARFEQMAQALGQAGKTEAAVEYFASVLRFKGDDADARERFGLLLAQNGNVAAAITNFNEVLRLRPDARAHYNLALALVMQGQANEAALHYRQALELSPDWPAALNDLAWLLATHPQAELRNGIEAVKLAEKACELDATEPRFHGTLDAAYAEAGRFEDAIRTAAKTRELALASGQTDLAQAAEKRLEFYRDRKPFRQQ